MAAERRVGVTRQILEVLEKNRDRIVTIDQLSEIINYDKSNLSTLISQLRKNRPNLIIEIPVAGAFLYRGIRSLDGVSDQASEPAGDAQPAGSPRPARAAAAKISSSPLNTGDLVEVIGFSQDTTPIVRDGNGKLYLLNQL